MWKTLRNTNDWIIWTDETFLSNETLEQKQQKLEKLWNVPETPVGITPQVNRFMVTGEGSWWVWKGGLRKSQSLKTSEDGERFPTLWTHGDEGSDIMNTGTHLCCCKSEVKTEQKKHPSETQSTPQDTRSCDTDIMSPTLRRNRAVHSNMNISRCSTEAGSQDQHLAAQQEAFTINTRQTLRPARSHVLTSTLMLIIDEEETAQGNKYFLLIIWTEIWQHAEQS